MLFYCLFHTVGVTNGEDDMRETRDSLTWKTVFVKGDLDYEQWYNKYVKTNVELMGKGIYDYIDSGQII